MNQALLDKIQSEQFRKEPSNFNVGDSVRVHTKVVEGDKERIQVFSGTVIMKKGRGINETFTVRRIVNNEGVERIFPLHSPYISKITVKRSGINRRAKLFYLRDRVGKAVRLTEKRKVKAGAPAGGGAAEGQRPKAELAAAAS